MNFHCNLRALILVIQTYPNCPAGKHNNGYPTIQSFGVQWSKSPLKSNKDDLFRSSFVQKKDTYHNIKVIKPSIVDGYQIAFTIKNLLKKDILNRFLITSWWFHIYYIYFIIGWVEPTNQIFGANHNDQPTEVHLTLFWLSGNLHKKWAILTPFDQGNSWRWRRGSKHLPPDAIRYFLAAIPTALEEKKNINGGFGLFLHGYAYYMYTSLETLVEHFHLKPFRIQHFAILFLAFSGFNISLNG